LAQARARAVTDGFSGSLIPCAISKGDLEITGLTCLRVFGPRTTERVRLGCLRQSCRRWRSRSSWRRVRRADVRMGGRKGGVCVKLRDHGYYSLVSVKGVSENL